jgi:anti-sigma28 factor (negative regulator of flagellin synthesis)
MAMHNIGRPPQVQPGALERFRKQAAGATRDKETAAAGSATRTDSQAVAGERLEISDQARKLESMRRALLAGRRAYEEAPEVRPERLAEVRARLDSGVYETQEVRQTVADRLGAVLRKLDALIE